MSANRLIEWISSPGWGAKVGGLIAFAGWSLIVVSIVNFIVA